MKTLYWQSVMARGEALRRLLAWPRLSFTPVIKIPTSDSNAMSIIGIGDFFDPYFSEEVMCICIKECDEVHPGGDLSDLVKYLKNGGMGNATSIVSH